MRRYRSIFAALLTAFALPATARKLVLLAIAVLALPACAQVINIERDRVQMTPLAGMMRFHTGDDPKWSEPGFDDSSWPLISPERDWDVQGYRNYGEFAWYRFKVILPPEHSQLGLYIPRIVTSYQVFADGKRLGSFGGFPPHATVYDVHRHLVLLPQTQAAQMEIAIRVWHWPHWATYYGGGMVGAPRIGDAGALKDWMTLQDKSTFWQSTARNCTALLCFLYCVAGFVLFLIRRKEREYLWYGLLGFFFFASPLLSDFASFHDLPVFMANGLGGMLSAAGFFSFVMFTWTLLGRKDTLWVWVSAGVLILEAMVWVSLPLLDLQIANAILFLTVLATTIVPMILLIQGVRRGSPDARLLVIPQGLNTLANWIESALEGLAGAGHAWAKPILAFWTETFHWPFPFGLYDLSIWIIVLAVLGVVVLRFARSRHQEDVLKNEMEAARAVQQVLIPDAIPAVPGFKIESVYKPAGEVGGDFFQILPTSSGGVLIVIGDVSGKGMPAAMTVSLLVGTARTLAHYSQSPGEILSAMNQRMLARSNGGFTTCLVLRVDSDRTIVAANAGHLAPYLNGVEVALENGLPLGLAANSAYVETTAALSQGGIITLLTDGVVEAQNERRELFGFERTRDLSTRSAEEIAHAAQAFGQNDDITVLTLSFT